LIVTAPGQALLHAGTGPGLGAKSSRQMAVPLQLFV